MFIITYDYYIVLFYTVLLLTVYSLFLLGRSVLIINHGVTNSCFFHQTNKWHYIKTNELTFQHFAEERLYVIIKD